MGKTGELGQEEKGVAAHYLGSHETYTRLIRALGSNVDCPTDARMAPSPSSVSPGTRTRDRIPVKVTGPRTRLQKGEKTRELH